MSFFDWVCAVFVIGGFAILMGYTFFNLLPQ